MTMNMPPQYNQAPRHMPQRLPTYNNTHNLQTINVGYQNANYGRNLHSRPTQTYVDRPYSANIPTQYDHNRSQSPLHAPSYVGNPAYRGVSPNVSRKNINPQYLNRAAYQSPSPAYQRQNNFMRPEQVYGMSQGHSHSPIYQQAPYQGQNYNPYAQDMYQHNYKVNTSPFYGQYGSYPQGVPQNYMPIYTSPGMNNYPNINQMVYEQPRKNFPQKSINSNFSYENANFDVNYSVEQNLVHCVICNQTYKTTQKKQHLQLHRQKVKNVDIRAVDLQQLKRLEKYNNMARKGLMIKPIVEPDEFNVQYNPNEFVLNKVTQYNDIDGPRTKTIQIQTQNFAQANNRSRMYNSGSRRQDSSNMDEIPQEQGLNRQGSNRPPSNIQSLGYNNPRITNTRFNSDSVREEQKIFLSDKFENSHQGEDFKSNYNPDESFRGSQRKSNYSPSRVNETSYRGTNTVTPTEQLGYNNNSKLNYRNAESINSVNEEADYSYDKKLSLHNINEADEYRNSKPNQISLNQIIGEVSRQDSY